MGIRPTGLRLCNPGATTVDLGGWYLTDKANNPAKWQFPSLPLPAGPYFIVFASGINFLAAPLLSRAGGAITSGCTLTLTSQTLEPNSRIYYTLDGTDPRLPGGTASSAALSALNTATITLTTNTQVFARNWNANHHNLTGPGNPPLSSPWSGPARASFYSPPRFQSIAALPDGSVRLAISCQAGLSCSLEVSADLTTWLSLTNFDDPAGVLQFLDDSATGNAARFYRAQQ